MPEVGGSGAGSRSRSVAGVSAASTSLAGGLGLTTSAPGEPKDEISTAGLLYDKVYGDLGRGYSRLNENRPDFTQTSSLATPSFRLSLGFPKGGRAREQLR